MGGPDERIQTALGIYDSLGGFVDLDRDYYGGFSKIRYFRNRMHFQVVGFFGNIAVGQPFEMLYQRSVDMTEYRESKERFYESLACLPCYTFITDTSFHRTWTNIRFLQIQSI